MGENHRCFHRSPSSLKIAGLIYLPYVRSIMVLFRVRENLFFPCLLILNQDSPSDFFDIEMLGWEDDEEDFEFDDEDDLDMIDEVEEEEEEEDLFEEDEEEEEEEDDYDELDEDLDEDFEDDFDDLDIDPDDEEEDF